MSEEQAEYITDALEMIGHGYNTQQVIADASDLRKYRIELPNLYDDSDLDPYEFRLLAHYKRVGVCTESTRTTATRCKMSPGQVSEKRQSIADKGFIELHEVVLKSGGFSYRIIVLDKWQENFSKYSERVHSVNRRVHQVNERVHSVKQRINHIKKEQTEEVKEGASAKPKPPKASDFPELVLFREVVRHWPKSAQRETVIESVQKINARLLRPATVDDLAPFWKAWGVVSGNEWSLVWLVEWAVSGNIPNGNNNHVPQGAVAGMEWLNMRKSQEARHG